MKNKKLCCHHVTMQDVCGCSHKTSDVVFLNDTIKLPSHRNAALPLWSGHHKLFFAFFWKGCLEFQALFSGRCKCYRQVILVWTPLQLSQLRFVCCTAHNGLPVVAEPLSPVLQSELGADRHGLRHNVGLSPCERRANVNRRANRECLDGREDVNLGPADTVQTSENKGRFTPKTCSRISPSWRFVGRRLPSLQCDGTRWLVVLKGP